MFPNFAMKAAGFSMVVFGLIALLGGLVQINPIWLFGPYKAAVVSAASQPDWYVMFMDGSTRLMPAWDILIPIGDGYTIPALFWPTLVLPGLLTMVPMFYPFIEARLHKDREFHHLLQRPRDAPARSALGAMAIAFYMVLLISGANDVVAEKLDISLNAMTWIGRVGLLIAPPVAYYVTYRICLGLQQHDREVLAHGVETGIIRRLPDGRFMEVHQPLGPGRRARPRRAGVRGCRDPEEDEPPRGGRPGRARVLLPGREARPAAAAAGHRPGVAGRRAGRHGRRRRCRPCHPVRDRGDGAGGSRPTVIH